MVVLCFSFAFCFILFGCSLFTSTEHVVQYDFQRLPLLACFPVMPWSLKSWLSLTFPGKHWQLLEYSYLSNVRNLFLLRKVVQGFGMQRKRIAKERAWHVTVPYFDGWIRPRWIVLHSGSFVSFLIQGCSNQEIPPPERALSPHLQWESSIERVKCLSLIWRPPRFCPPTCSLGAGMLLVTCKYHSLF